MQFSCAQTTTTTRKRIGAPYGMPSLAGRGVAWAPSSASVMTCLYCVHRYRVIVFWRASCVVSRQSPAPMRLVPIWYSCTGNSLPCPAGMPPAIEERCKAEIVRLHDAFVAWFTGSCDSSGDTYERTIGSVLSPSFSMVTPTGSVIPANLLHERLQAAYGSHSEHGMAIEIKNVEVVSSSGSQYLVRYEEWQRSGSPEVETARQSTAFFQESGPTSKLIWVHVHETWMPGMGPP